VRVQVLDIIVDRFVLLLSSCTISRTLRLEDLRLVSQT
jgi:hypothetical protein